MNLAVYSARVSGERGRSWGIACVLSLALHFGVAGFGGVFASVRFLGIDRLFERGLPAGEPISIDILVPDLDEVDDGVVDPGGPIPALAAASNAAPPQVGKAAPPPQRQSRRPVPGRVRRAGPKPAGEAVASTTGLPPRDPELDPQQPARGEPDDAAADQDQPSAADDGHDLRAGGSVDAKGGAGTGSPSSLAGARPPVAKALTTSGVGAALGPGTRGSGHHAGIARPAGRAREGFHKVSLQEAEYLRTRDDYPETPYGLRRPGLTLEYVLELCVSEVGNVEDVRLLQGASPEMADLLMQRMKSWKYRPYMVNGHAAPFCHPLKVQYQY